MLEAGARYLQTVGPAYGFFGLGMALYFSSQGAGRLAWPLFANFARLLLAAGGGWLVLQSGGGVDGIFAAQAAGLATFGLIVASAIARGAWGVKLVWSGPLRDGRDERRGVSP